MSLANRISGIAGQSSLMIESWGDMTQEEFLKNVQLMAIQNDINFVIVCDGAGSSTMRALRATQSAEATRSMIYSEIESGVYDVMNKHQNGVQEVRNEMRDMAVDVATANYRQAADRNIEAINKRAELLTNRVTGGGTTRRRSNGAPQTTDTTPVTTDGGTAPTVNNPVPMRIESEEQARRILNAPSVNKGSPDAKQEQMARQAAKEYLEEHGETSNRRRRDNTPVA